MGTWFHVYYNWRTPARTVKNLWYIAQDLFWYGPKNVCRWAPIIWMDADFDYAFLLTVMEYKLRRLSDCLENGHLSNGSRYARQTLIAAALCKRIREDKVYRKSAEVWPENGPHQSRHVLSIKKQDQEMLGKLIGKYITHWWD